MGKPDFKCVITGGTGEITEKKSRFIASVAPVSSEEEAIAFVDEIRKANRTARHNCYAYTVGVNPALTRFSDDGEPSGTAGKPMLDILTNLGLHNTAVVVTRYFGGILLGTGGLVRAYTDAVKAGIDNCAVATKQFGRRLLIKTEYSAHDGIRFLANSADVPYLGAEYGEDVITTVFVTPEKEEAFIEKVMNATLGKAVVTKLEECCFACVNGKNTIFEA